MKTKPTNPAPTKITLAYSYFRISSLGQKEGDWNRRASKKRKDWLDRHPHVRLVRDMRDIGLSAYHKRNIKNGALGAFIAEAEKPDSKIPKGSILLVENLDRVTRANITDAMTLFLRILAAGIELVTMDDEAHYTKANVDKDPWRLMGSLMILARGNNESETKSIRATSAHSGRLEKVVNGEAPVYGNLPKWIVRDGDGKPKVDIKKAAIIRRIFEMRAAGMPEGAIAYKLNDEKVKPLYWGDLWTKSVVRGYVANRAVLGEFTYKKAKTVIPHAFPAIIPPALFATVNRIARRKNTTRGTTGVNVFKGIAHTATGANLVLSRTVFERGGHLYNYKHLRAYEAARGGARGPGWDYEDFHRNVIGLLKAAAHRPAKAAKMVKLDLAGSLAAELEDLKAEIANIAKSLAKGFSETMDDLMREKEAEKAALAAKLAEARALNGVEPIKLDKVDWNDPDDLYNNLHATLAKITVDIPARAFVIETLDGHFFRYEEKNGEAFFAFDDAKAVPAAVLAGLKPAKKPRDTARRAA